MPITIKQGLMKVKNSNGNYIDVDVTADSTTEAQIAAVQAVGLAQQAALAARAQEIEEDWPDTYTELTDEVDDLKSAVNSESTVPYAASDFTAGRYNNSGAFNSNETDDITNRTAIPDNVTQISTESDYFFDLTAWSGETFLGHYDSSGSFNKITPSGEERYTRKTLDLKAIRLANPTATVMRVTARKIVGGEIATPSTADATLFIKTVEEYRFVTKAQGAGNAGKALYIDTAGQIAMKPDSNQVVWSEQSTGYASCATGAINSNNTTFNRTDYIRVLPGKSYYYSGRILSNAGVVGYTKDLAFAGSVLNGNDPETAQTFTNQLLIIPNGVAYIIASSRSTATLRVVCTDDPDEYMQDAVQSAALDPVLITDDECVSISMFSRVGFCGDSYTRGSIGGVETYSANTAYPKILGRMTGIDTRIFAHGGANTKTFLTTFATDCIGKLETEAETEPCDLYVIMLGINADSSIGTIADLTDESADSFYGNMGKIYRRIIAASPSAKIILVKPPRIGSAADVYDAIDAIADALEIPCFGCMDDQYFSTPFYTDHVVSYHPIAVTYSGMAKAMVRLVEKCMYKYVEYFADYTSN